MLISQEKSSNLGFFSFFSFTFPFLPKVCLELPWRVDCSRSPKGRTVGVCFLSCLDDLNHHSFPNFLSDIFLGHWFPALIPYFWHEGIRNYLRCFLLVLLMALVFSFHFRVCARILSDQDPSLFQGSIALAKCSWEDSISFETLDITKANQARNQRNGLCCVLAYLAKPAWHFFSPEQKNISFMRLIIIC